MRDERGVYERLCLEGFQSGLSWLTILRKREAFRAAFAGFDPDRVAAFGEADVERLLGDAGIVRHRGKIEAAIANARATVALRDGGEPLQELFWRARAGGAAGAAVARRLGAVDAGVGRARQAPAQGGLPVRRRDDDLCRDAGMRGRERPPRGVLGARPGRAGASRLMLDERVLAVLRRLEDEDARDDAPARPVRERSLAIAPSSGALLFGLAAGRVGCELLEIGGSHGYSALWLGAAARLAGGRLTSLEAEPAKVARLIENIAAAGLGGWVEIVPGDAFETLPGLGGGWGLVFLDAWKEDYESLFGLVRPRLAPAASWSPTTWSPTVRRSPRTPPRGRRTRRSRASRCRSTTGWR